jgi:hypothetical protein
MPLGDDIKALGHGLLALFNAAILVALIAVVLNSRGNGAALITDLFSVLSWLVGQVVTPLKAASNVDVTATQALPAGTYVDAGSWDSGIYTPGSTGLAPSAVTSPTGGLPGTSNSSGGSTLPGSIPTIIITPGGYTDGAAG